MGNNQYERMPIRFPKVTYCEYINTSYRKYFMNSFKSPVSNLPYSDDPNADLCEAFRADHDVRTNSYLLFQNIYHSITNLVFFVVVGVLCS